MKKDKPGQLVSIIMTTFNREQLVKESIASILAQSYSNWELLIADDGSTDDTIKIIKEINDDRIHILQYSHCGISGQLKNLAIKNCRGDLIAFNDSDDLWSPEKLEKQVGALNEIPVAGFCVSNGYNFIEKGTATEYFYKERTGYRKGWLLEAYFESRLSGFTQALLVRKECVQAINGFKEEKSFSDIDFIARLASCTEGIILYEPLFYRRLHETNYISKNWEKSYGEGLDLVISFRNQISKTIFRKAVYRLYVNKAEKYRKVGKRLNAIKCLVKALRYAPFNVLHLKKFLKLYLPQLVVHGKVP